METLKFENREEWLEARRGKVTGSKLKDVIVKRGTGQKIGFYELIADRLGIPADGEDPMERGTRLEAEALEKFAKETGKKIENGLRIMTRSDNPNIAYSPDATIGKSEDVEVKCLSSARHLEALITKSIPNDYHYQVLQGFIVNDSLKKRHVVFYDPRVLAAPYFVITVHRKDMEEEIKEYLEYQKNLLKQVDEIVLSLTF